MDKGTARILAAATSRFYREQAASFSVTRQTAWQGWSRLMEGPAGTAFEEVLEGDAAHTLLDVGCGNLRFERFLCERFPRMPLQASVVDNCNPLVAGGDAPATLSMEYRQLDVVDALLAGTLDAALAAVPACKLVACFGFFHHVPGAEHRQALLRALLDKATPSGAVAVSLWRFLNSEALARKAAVEHRAGMELLTARDGLDAAGLEPGDYLLGWQGTPGAVRYCHAFDAAEIDALAASVADIACVADRFEADGRTGNLNTYLVFTRRSTRR